MVLVLTSCAVGVPMPDCFQAGKPVFRFVVMTDIICLEWTDGRGIGPLDGTGLPLPGDPIGISQIGC